MKIIHTFQAIVTELPQKIFKIILDAETHQKIDKKAKIRVKRPQQHTKKIFLALQKHAKMIYSPK